MCALCGKKSVHDTEVAAAGKRIAAAGKRRHRRFKFLKFLLASAR